MSVYHVCDRCSKTIPHGQWKQPRFAVVYATTRVSVPASWPDPDLCETCQAELDRVLSEFFKVIV